MRQHINNATPVHNLVYCSSGANCENAVECLIDRGVDDPLDVICTGCGATFCFNCKEEAHRPVRQKAALAAAIVAAVVAAVIAAYDVHHCARRTTATNVSKEALSRVSVTTRRLQCSGA